MTLQSIISLTQKLFEFAYADNVLGDGKGGGVNERANLGGAHDVGHRDLAWQVATEVDAGTLVELRTHLLCKVDQLHTQ